MSFLTVPDDAAAAAVPQVAADAEAMGYVPNYARLLALRPAAYAAWAALNAAVKSTMDPRRYELATLAAAGQLSSTYCQLAHGGVLLRQGVDADDLVAMVQDRHDPDLSVLSEVEVAVMDLAAAVAGDATSVSQADVDRLVSLGLSDTEVLDVVLAASARCFFSKTLDATGTRADAVYRARLPPAVLEVLTTGRPVDHPADAVARSGAETTPTQ